MIYMFLVKIYMIIPWLDKYERKLWLFLLKFAINIYIYGFAGHLIIKVVEVFHLSPWAAVNLIVEKYHWLLLIMGFISLQ